MFVFPLAASVGLVLAGVWLLQGERGALDAAQTAASLRLYLPVANASINLPLLLALGFGVGILSGMTGVGGAFLMTPLLMAMGVPASVAVGTSSTQIAGTAASGTLAHGRLGNVDVKLGLVALAGSLIGGTIGVQIVAIWRVSGNFDFWLRIIYVLMAGIVGTLMLREGVGVWMRSAKARRSFESNGGRLSTAPNADAGKLMPPQARCASRWPLRMAFKKAQIHTSLLLPLGLGGGIGLLAAIMGVGGGFIVVPAMIYVLGVPTHVAVGTSLFQLVFTAANVGFQQAVTNQNVDLILALTLMVGAAFGAQVGTQIGHRLEAYQLRAFLGLMLALVAVKMFMDVTLPPVSVIMLAGSA